MNLSTFIQVFAHSTFDSSKLDTNCSTTWCSTPEFHLAGRAKNPGVFCSNCRLAIPCTNGSLSRYPLFRSLWPPQFRRSRTDKQHSLPGERSAFRNSRPALPSPPSPLGSRAMSSLRQDWIRSSARVLPRTSNRLKRASEVTLVQKLKSRE
jgi:hypothetical protein